MTLTRLSFSILKSTVSDALTSIARRCSRTGVVTFSSEGRAQADDLFWVKLRRLPRAIHSSLRSGAFGGSLSM
jgi:hypothetical protein